MALTDSDDTTDARAEDADAKAEEADAMAPVGDDDDICVVVVAMEFDASEMPWSCAKAAVVKAVMR